MENDIIGALAAFAVGALICFVNYKLSDYFIKHSPDRFPSVSFVRQLIQVLYLAALFFAAGYTPWDRTWLLAGGALGITLPMILSTLKLIKTNRSLSEKKKEEKEGDKNG